MKFMIASALAFAFLQAPAMVPVAFAQTFQIEFAAGEETVATADGAWIAALPQVEREVRFETSQGPSGGVFTGVDLWAALERAGLLEEEGGRPDLARSVTATGEDGYEVLYSLGEIAPGFGANPIMIATGVDGEPLAADRLPRMVVPGDTRGARMLYRVVRITLR